MCKFGYMDRMYFIKKYMKPLLSEKKLVLTIPNKPNSSQQKYKKNI
ncbi:MAG: hypothetical protein K2F56_04095 [Anaeroplasmataceae bacterium]|nr:hypothetical protein [Anaeroplasmataceae bacterium]